MRNNKIIQHTKETYSAFINRIESAESSKIAIEKDLNYSETNTEKFAGTPDLKSAINQALNGWNAGIEQMQLESISFEGVGIKAVNSYSGGAINIGAYIGNQPQAFTRFKKESTLNLPRLTIYTRLTYSGGNSIEKALNFSKTIVKTVNKLQAENDVQVIGVFESNQSGGVMINEVILKPYGMQLVLNNLAAAFHPSFFRRLWFRHLETSGFDFNSGYGSIVSSLEALQKNIIETSQYKDPYIITPNLDSVRNSSGEFKESECTTKDFEFKK